MTLKRYVMLSSDINPLCIISDNEDIGMADEDELTAKKWANEETELGDDVSLFKVTIKRII